MQAYPGRMKEGATMAVQPDMGRAVMMLVGAAIFMLLLWLGARMFLE